MIEESSTNQLTLTQADPNPHADRTPPVSTEPKPDQSGQFAMNAVPVSAPIVRPLLAVTLLTIGWIVVLSLTVVGFTRYRRSAPSATVTAPNETGLHYLRTIHDRLTTW